MNVTRALRGVLSSVPTAKVHSSAAAGVASDWVPMAEAVLVSAYLPSLKHANSDSILSLSADINECTEGTSGCTQSCSNTLGSFQCGCNNGFRLSGNGRTCNGMYVLE